MMKNKRDLAQQLIDSFMEFKKNNFSGVFNDELNKTETVVLFFISKDENVYFNPSFLSDKVGLSRPSITLALNSLEDSGYIERILDKEDRRRMKVILTDKGKKLIHKGQEKMYEQVYHMIDRLGEKDTLELIRITTKLFEKENIDDKNT